jgi:hypothetical protein
MTRFFELLVAIVIVAAVFLIFGVFLPNKRNVETAMETNHPVRQVYDTLNSFRRFSDWNALRMHDPSIEYTLEGPVQGVGAKLNYRSKDVTVGSGSWEIVGNEQDKYVLYEITNSRYGFDKFIRFDLEKDNKIVEIKARYEVAYDWDLRGRYAGMYVDRTAGDDLRSSIANLVGLIATMPNFDYKSMEIEYAVVEPENILYMSTSSARNITAVDNAMVASLDLIKKAIADNKLVADGAPRLITTSFGSDKYEFDVAIPVKRPSDDDMAAADAEKPMDAKPEEEEAMEDDAMADAGMDGEAMDGDLMDETEMAAVEVKIPVKPDAPEMIELAPLEGLTLPENLLQGQSYQGLALRAKHVGHPAALPLIRDMLRSYAAANGEEIHQRAFEEHLTDISEAAEDAEFLVYWPIK